jgi:hypothetical protein
MKATNARDEFTVSPLPSDPQMPGGSSRQQYDPLSSGKSDTTPMKIEKDALRRFTVLE